MAVTSKTLIFDAMLEEAGNEYVRELFSRSQEEREAANVARAADLAAGERDPAAAPVQPLLGSHVAALEERPASAPGAAPGAPARPARPGEAPRSPHGASPAHARPGRRRGPDGRFLSDPR